MHGANIQYFFPQKLTFDSVFRCTILFLFVLISLDYQYHVYSKYCMTTVTLYY